ncbi:hypothetical protein EYC84_002023 [Monilinia fructicola]|uniref:CID domain-containing protein n=1 Tax=Monilinia fructicola TaxID=38448 RepID=A0A5M9JU02_MONFR|nr:hypothetical protein EYC84_002023 [Monilinia fructicola]
MDPSKPDPLRIKQKPKLKAAPKEIKMDPFEVRIRFTQYLQHLNATVTSANKTAQYALKYRDMDEDLHSCILEQLEKNSMNNRANIMYFIEILCDMASKEGHDDYVRMIQRDILRVVDAVAPEDGSGAANVKVVRKVLQGLQQKSFLLAQTVTEIEECLKERDTQPDVLMSSPPAETQANGNGTSQHATPKPAKPNEERHKRLREHIWAVPAEVPDAEFDKLWDETSELGDDDMDLYEEEAMERKEAGREWREEQVQRSRHEG